MEVDMSLIILLLFSLSLGTWARTTPGPTQPPGHMRLQERDQRTCYLLEDSAAKNISVIYTKDDKKLYLQKGEGRSLPDCSSVVGPVELDTCIPCVREEQVRAACLLTDPSAELDFEARGKSVPLNKKKFPCETAPAPDPDAPEDLGVGVTVPGPDAAKGLGVGDIVLIVVVVVLGAAAAGFGVFVLAKKMWSKYGEVPQPEKADYTCCTCLSP